MPDDIRQPDGTRKPMASRYFKKAQLARKVTVKTVTKTRAPKKVQDGIKVIYDVSHQRKEVTNARHVQHGTRGYTSKNARLPKTLMSSEGSERLKMEREPAPTVSLDTLIRQKSEPVPSWFPKR